jgi:hypothetical protein
MQDGYYKLFIGTAAGLEKMVEGGSSASCDAESRMEWLGAGRQIKAGGEVD